MKARIQTRNLRQQVTFERKRRNLIFFTVVSLAVLYMLFAVVFGNMGLLKYRSLTKIKSRLDTEIVSLDKENNALKTHVDSLKNDNYYIEKYAREEYGLARPNEYIFQFKDDGR
ncbi:MAG: septum formation initiator family protein [Nitrospirae bacterium]|nr:septum formation initiator family protein [Nitrospirota bacterium]